MISSFSQEQFQQFYEFSGGRGGGGGITEKYPIVYHPTQEFHYIYNGLFCLIWVT